MMQAFRQPCFGRALLWRKSLINASCTFDYAAFKQNRLGKIMPRQ